jgi:hypothetical protein
MDPPFKPRGSNGNWSFTPDLPVASHPFMRFSSKMPVM